MWSDPIKRVVWIGADVERVSIALVVNVVTA